MKRFINIGGVPYSTKAFLTDTPITIKGYDLNTERHLIVDTPFEKNKRIELDNAQLKLREKFTKVYK